MANFMATAGADALAGAGTDADNIIVNQQVYLNAGDSFDGGGGTDILWLTKGMMGIDMPGDLDFQQVTLLNIEELNFNYMGMPMPGQAIFSSAQFGAGLLSDSLVVRGSWGSNDIVISLVTGDSSFDASGWTFPTNDLEGDATGTATSMWGSYIYDNPSNPSSPYTGLEVGTPTEAVQNGWPAGVVYQNGVPGDTVTLIGSTGNNAITGSIVADIVRGDEGNDTLSGGGGNDSIDGGDGQDTALFSGNFEDYIITEENGTYTVVDNRDGSPDGTDVLTGIEVLTFAQGSVEPGSAGPYYATSRMDLLMGSGFDEDFITNKQAYLGDDDVFNGGGGMDTLWAGQGMGETEPDGLYDENYDFSDVTLLSIEALAFNYMPMPMPGRAVFSSAQFGEGLLSDDLMVYGAWGDNKIFVNLADGDTLFDASGWQFANAGEAMGTESAVWGRYTYTGNAMGGMYKDMEVGGLDLIYFNGNADANRITGTSMRDVFRGGGGADTLIGGAGDDVYYIELGDIVRETAGGGRDTIYSEMSMTLNSHVEGLRLVGSKVLSGTGNGLANALSGNDAKNTLSGLVGDDTIRGGDGNDVLIGGAGADRLFGGAGRDTFVYKTASESSRTAPDRIFDLEAGDKINLRAIDANLGRAGNQAFVLDKVGDNSLAAGHIRQIESGSNLILDFNTDADAAAEMRIVLLNHGTVKASDFIL